MSNSIVVSNSNEVVETIPSYEVAKMMEREHKEVLKMLEGQKRIDGTWKHVGIIPTLEMGGEVHLSNFFIKSTYTDSMKRTKPCYECTKMGCELLANKMTGEKGILFTARYVKKFNEMQQGIQLNLNDIVTTLSATLDYKAEQMSQQLMTHCRLQMSQVENMVKTMIPKVIENIVDPMYKENHSLIGQIKEYRKDASLVDLLRCFDEHVMRYGSLKGYCYITPIAKKYGYENINNFNRQLKRIGILKGGSSAWVLGDDLEYNTHGKRGKYEGTIVWSKLGVVEIYFALANLGIYPKGE